MNNLGFQTQRKKKRNACVYSTPGTIFSKTVASRCIHFWSDKEQEQTNCLTTSNILADQYLFSSGLQFRAITNCIRVDKSLTFLCLTIHWENATFSSPGMRNLPKCQISPSHFLSKQNVFFSSSGHIFYGEICQTVCTGWHVFWKV